MKSLLKSALAAAVLAAPGFAFGAEYMFDPAHTSAQFSVKHLMVTNVRGEFNKVEGSINLDEKDITKSSANVTIDINSIDTREPRRDAHLKSDDFFAAEKFPTMTFKSTKVEKVAEGKLKLTGDLTIRGNTKSVVFDVEGLAQELKDPWGNITRGAVATTKLNRKDFGLMWNKALESGGFVVGDEVAVTLDIELKKKQPAPAAAPAAPATPAAPAAPAKK